MRNNMRLSVVSLIVGLMAGMSFGAVIMPTPFTDSFEGGSSPLDNWATNGSGSVTIATEAPDGGGTKSCVISNDAIKIDISNAYNVWAQVYTKAAGYDGDPADSQINGLAAVFYITKDGDVRVMDGDGSDGGTWTNVASLGALTGNKTDWEGFVVHLDYGSSTWDLYRQVSGQSGAATLSRIATGLGFRTNNAEMTSMEVSSELTASVDTIGLIAGYSDVGNSTYSNVVSTTEDHTTEMISMVIGDIDHYDTTSDRLDDEAGGDLMMGMIDGDKIQLYLTNGFVTFTYNGAGAWTPANDVHLATGQSWWREYATTSTSNLEFMAVGFNATGEDTPDMIGETINLWGDQGTGSAADGWSHTVYGGTSVAANSSGLADNLVSDTIVYVALPEQGFRAFFVRGNNLYDFNGNPANFNLQNGSQVWVRNLGNDAAWNIN